MTLKIADTAPLTFSENNYILDNACYLIHTLLPPYKKPARCGENVLYKIKIILLYLKMGLSIILTYVSPLSSWTAVKCLCTASKYRMSPVLAYSRIAAADLSARFQANSPGESSITTLITLKLYMYNPIHMRQKISFKSNTELEVKFYAKHFKVTLSSCLCKECLHGKLYNLGTVPLETMGPFARGNRHCRKFTAVGRKLQPRQRQKQPKAAVK